MAKREMPGPGRWFIGVFGAILLGGCQATPDIEMSLIATGANMAGANGVDLGPDGHLYVASVLGSSITVIDTESGEIIRTWDEAAGVIGPDDVAFASDGSWYWTSIMTGGVAGFTADGERIVAAQLGPGVNPITFSDDDRLFVSQCFFGTNLYEVDPSGASAPRLISDTLGPGCGLNGMDWGPDGRLYGPRWFRGEVVSFDVSDNSMRVEATGLEVPAAVKFDAAGQLHVLDTGAGAVMRIESGKAVPAVTLTAGLDNFVFDDAGRIFVSSFTDGSVHRVNVDGTVTALQPGGLSHAGGLAFHNGDIVAADLHALRAFKPDGSEAWVERNILGVGRMGGAINVASDGDGLLLTSWVDGDVRRWDPVARERTWQRAGLLAPVAAVRYGDMIVVAEHGRQRLVAFDEADPSTEEELATGLPAPTGLFARDGALYVSDRVLGKVLKVAEDGRALAWPVEVAGGLDTPEGFVVLGNEIVVMEADTGSIVAIDSGARRTVLGTVQPGTQAASAAQPPSQVFNGLTADEAGNIYVVDETRRELFRISR